MAALLRALEVELNMMPVQEAAYRTWRLEVSDLCSLKFTHVDVSSDQSPSFMKVTHANYATIYDASGTAQQKEASAENRALATMLRRSCAHTDSESITTTTDPDERTSGTHLLRMIDELHRTRMSTCLCQEERDRLKVLPKIRIAGFSECQTCLRVWTDSISRDVNAVNQYATRDVTLPDGTVRKVHLKLKVNQLKSLN